MPSKVVEIHRHYGFVHGANPDPEAKEYFDMAYKAIGSYYRVFGKVYESGLTREEENLLMPDLVGFYPEDKKDFRQAVNDYFRNINTKIPGEGLKLEIGLEKAGKISDNNMPLKPDHYVIFKHALKHPQVTDSKEEAERMGQLAHFYVSDKAEETKSRTKINRLEDDASMHYFQYRDDHFKTEQILTLMGVNTRTLDEEERTIKLKELSTIDEAMADKANEARLQKFIDTAKDKDLATKYDLMEMIRFNILERVSSKILDKESGEILGNNLREAVIWFQDKRNSKDVNVYYARLEELGKSSRNTSAQKPQQEKEEIIATPVEMGESAMSDFNEKKEDEPKDDKK